jgi:hypothetical protein
VGETLAPTASTEDVGELGRRVGRADDDLATATKEVRSNNRLALPCLRSVNVCKIKLP